jgi:glycosyltransferase involved in cell wall biosynthesis
MPDSRSQTTQPLISVVIPCYNRQDYIQEAVDSALKQTWENTEVIVVDDGSTDDSVKLLQSYESRIKLFTQPNAGVAAARNTGIHQAKGKWIALLDSDDVWIPNKLESQMALVSRWPDAVLLYTLCSTIDTESKSLGTPPEILDDRFELDSLERLLHHCGPTTSSVVMRRDALIAAGSFDVQFEQNGGFAAEDWELYVRIAERGPFAFAGKCLTHYRVHPDSKSLGDRLRHTIGLVSLRERIDTNRERWLNTRPHPEIDVALATHREQYAHVLGRLGLIYLDKRQWQEASNCFRKATELEPMCLKHRIRLGIAQLQAGIPRSRAPRSN